MRRFASLIALLLLVSSTACSVAYPPKPAVRRAPTEVAATYGRAWEAAIEELADFNAPITQLHRESGYLNTDMVRVAAASKDTLAECWRIKRFFGGDSLVQPTNALYNVVVRGDSSRAWVKVNARWVHILFTGAGPLTTTCESRGVWERRTEAAIKGRAEAKR